MPSPVRPTPPEAPVLIRAEGRGTPLPGPDPGLFAPEVLAQAWAQVMSAADARKAAAEAYAPGQDPETVAWNEGTIVLVALLSEAYRERVRRLFRWSEADLARRIEAARPMIEEWRREASRGDP